MQFVFSSGSAPVAHHFMYDVILLGAGASGLMCARTACARGFSCAVVDRSPVAGRKVRLSGGGKGNITNLRMGPEWYVCGQKGFVDAVLRRCPTSFVLEMLERFRIPWEERDYGQIFCTVQAARLVESLVEEAEQSGAKLFLGRDIGDVLHDGNILSVHTSDGIIYGKRLVIATGSPAWPSCGASDFGMRLARQWGHKVIPVHPVLSPLVFPEEWIFHGLAGISLPVRIGVGERHFEYPLLFTHKGLSGPAILQASCFWRPGIPLRIDFLPGQSLIDIMHQSEHGKTRVRTLFRSLLPARLADLMLESLPDGAKLAERQIAQLGRQDRMRLASAIHEHTVTPTRTEGMMKAEAAAGGVDTRDINPRTLESRHRQGIYFIGEVLDVAGLLGGYNLHWAWASGKACGEALKEC